ncbi:MAG: hypothetical protein KAR06_03975 [Deltaproteobacteria bacterium]|nr:hypothetical protein [Deltaproteobacteria bacterium]
MSDEKCPVCGNNTDECVCCAECGHDCPLDIGEEFCPVCSPKPLNDKCSI